MVRVRKSLARLVLMAMFLTVPMAALIPNKVYAENGGVSDSRSSIISWVQENASLDSNGEVEFKKSSGMKSYFSTDANKFTTPQTVDVTIGSDVVIIYYDSTAEAEISRKIDKLNQSGNVSKQVDDITEGLGIKADVKNGAFLLSGLSDGISYVLGIIVTLTTLGVTIFTALDVLYMAYPVFQDNCNQQVQSGSGPMSKKNKKTGESELRFITHDAQTSVSESVETGKNVYFLYLKKRIVTYLALAVALFILLTGNMNILINLALYAVSGLLNMIANFNV